MKFELFSKAFENNGKIPDVYNHKGKNISPPLNWINPPNEAKSYAIVVEDFDVLVGSFTH